MMMTTLSSPPLIGSSCELIKFNQGFERLWASPLYHSHALMMVMPVHMLSILVLRTQGSGKSPIDMIGVASALQSLPISKFVARSTSQAVHDSG